MRRLLLVGWLALVGCAGVVGPFQRPFTPYTVEDPWLTPDEQKMRFRDQVALPDASRAIGPRTYADNPALRGQ